MWIWHTTLCCKLTSPDTPEWGSSITQEHLTCLQAVYDGWSTFRIAYDPHYQRTLFQTHVLQGAYWADLLFGKFKEFHWVLFFSHELWLTCQTDTMPCSQTISILYKSWLTRNTINSCSPWMTKQHTKSQRHRLKHLMRQSLQERPHSTSLRASLYPLRTSLRFISRLEATSVQGKTWL